MLAPVVPVEDPDFELRGGGCFFALPAFLPPVIMVYSVFSSTE